MNVKYLLCFLVLALASVVQADTSAPKAAQGLIVSEAKVRVPMPGRDVTVAYFNLHNRNDREHTLVSVATPITERAEMHSHSHEDGMMRMRKEEKVAIPAEGHLRFQPGGYHVMLYDLQHKPQTGEQVELVLTFEDGSQLVVDADTESVFDRPHNH